MADQAIESALPRPIKELDDDMLISMFQGGDEAAFGVLVQRYSERIRNLIYSVFNSPELIDDLSQDVFIKVYKALPRFKFNASFYTWLYRITINRCRDEMRKKKIRKVFSLEGMMREDDDETRLHPTVEPEDLATRELINTGLQSLPEKYRLPVVLKDIDGLSYEEMTEVMQCAPGTVKSRLSRGRTMLRTYLEPHLEA